MKALFSVRGAMLTALMVLLFNHNALACPACYDGGNTGSKMANAANWGIIAMVIIMFAMLGAVAGFGFYLNYRAKHPLPDYEELLTPDEGKGLPNPGTAH